MRRSKLLFHSNAPWAATGYGNQTALFAPRLRDAGFDVAVSAFYGLSGSILEWNGIRVYPSGIHPYGNDSIHGHARHWFGDPRAGLLVTLVDAWVLDPGVLSGMRSACWAPVDHETVPPAVAEVLARSGCRPLAMTRHAEAAMKQIGLDPRYVPHGVDTQAFQPLDRTECRKALSWPEDAFIVGMVAANKGYPPRKGFPEALQAFARFLQKHPNSMLYLHTEPLGKIQGVNLINLLKANGIQPDNVRFCDPYQYSLGFNTGHMAAAYSAMDVLLNPSYGEGFGIPMLEAQACGTPVISTNHTAMPEVGDVGWVVSGQRIWTDQQSYQMVPSIVEIVSALEQAVGLAGRLRGRAREHALTYDADLVVEKHWIPALEEMLEPQPLPGIVVPAEVPAAA